MKRSIFLLLLIIACSGSVCGLIHAKERNKMIAMIIARNNFRDEELMIPKKVFENAGYKVVIFSSSLGIAKGMLGATQKIENVINRLNPGEYDAVIFVGGTGAEEYWEDTTAHKIAKDTLANDKVLGAICIAPVTLANAGVLKDKKAAVWPSEKENLKKHGAIYTKEPVVKSGKVVTADGPQSADKFADAILDLLK